MNIPSKSQCDLTTCFNVEPRNFGYIYQWPTGRRFGVYVGEETSGLMNFATRNPCNLSRTSAAQLNY